MGKSWIDIIGGGMKRIALTQISQKQKQSTLNYTYIFKIAWKCA